MLFLWIYGDNVEHRLGPVRYLAAYLATGVAATLFHTRVRCIEFGAAAGRARRAPSPACSAFFYFIWFPRNRVRLWIMLFPFFMHVVRWPARLVLGIYLFIDNVMPFLIAQGGAGGGVAYGAHIGGFLGGLGWAWWSERREITTRPAEYRDGGYAPGNIARPDRCRARRGAALRSGRRPSTSG